MTTPPRVSCIVPAFNEGARIGAVLTILTAHSLVDEVLVIDDCSTDDTAAVARRFSGVTLLCLPQNGGKTNALAAGLGRAQGEVLLLIDADLIGLDADALTALIRPVLDGNADISISLRRNAPRLWHLIGIDYISGERAMKRGLLEGQIGALGSLPRFGFEVWLNDLCIRAAARIAIIRWDNVDSPGKTKKRGIVRGILADIRMIGDMMRTIAPLRLVRQIAAMRRMRISG